MTINKFALPLIVVVMALVGSSARAQNLTPAQQEDAIVASSIRAQFDILAAQRDVLEDEISALRGEMQSASKSKQRRLDKEIEELSTELEIVNRKIATFPRSLRDSNYATQQRQEVDTEFMEELQRRTDEKIAHKEVHLTQAELTGLTYRVMLTISRNPVSVDSFVGMSDILEQRASDGRIIYYQGSYPTEAEAERACEKILSTGRFRDAFVVGMDGYSRVE